MRNTINHYTIRDSNNPVRSKEDYLQNNWGTC
jgi:hypothetical protein